MSRRNKLGAIEVERREIRALLAPLPEVRLVGWSTVTSFTVVYNGKLEEFGPAAVAYLRLLSETLASLELLRDRKGGDPDEWPADLRVREFPAVRP